MPATIDAAPSVRAQVYAALEGDGPLLALLPNGIGCILPRAGIDPQKVARPFLFVRYEGGAPPGEASPDLGTWVIEVHERPGYGLVKVDALIARLRWIFDGARWDPATDGLARAYVSDWAGATGEVADQGWSTIKRLARLQVLHG